MECHKCPDRPKPVTRWENSACRNCVEGKNLKKNQQRWTGNERPSGRGVSHVSLDGCSETLPDKLAASANQKQETSDFGVFGEFLRQWLSLEFNELYIIAARFQGASYPEIAKKLRCSVQNVETRHADIVKKLPAIWTLFPRKRIGRQRYIVAARG